ncbi:hypothetical protein QE367_002396 [Microbacterium paludicola]|uniref:DUF4307 domain-containing protein n=1 Tax=Microbacterium paludicola TaxID=300019 RepID=A0ABU1I3V1_9MICO|nr:hypothetical protein [Microbacterium paludicola]MDR6168192.1 hypothetical protein [Microbacterium paludicola]
MYVVSTEEDSMDTSIDDLLRASAPRRVSTDGMVAAEVDRVGIAARVHAARRRRVRRLSWVALPVLALPGIALASTAGTDPRMIPDFEIPVSYVTDTGREISCSIELFNGELDYVETNTEAVVYIAAQNWDGVGQKIYERALEREAAGLVSPWFGAADDVIFAGVDDYILPGDGGLGRDTDCTGQLH